jgi:hypothetical protein
MEMLDKRVSRLSIVVAAAPYLAVGAPWFSAFRDPWFEAGGLTERQLQEGPGFAIAYSAATLTSLCMAYVLAVLIVRTGERTAVRGVGMGLLIWCAFIASVTGTQYIFEGRPLIYFCITAGYPLIGLVVMGAILGAWPSKAPEAGS